mgnify:CR=1 FL=1
MGSDFVGYTCLLTQRFRVSSRKCVDPFDSSRYRRIRSINQSSMIKAAGCTNTMNHVDTIIPFLNMLYEYMFLSCPLEVLLVACMRAHCKRPHDGLEWVIDAMHAMLHCIHRSQNNPQRHLELVLTTVHGCQ